MRDFIKHQSLVDGRAAEAATYPEELCKAIFRGIIQEKKERHYGTRAVAEIPRHLRPRRIDLEEFIERSETRVPMTALRSLTVCRETTGRVNRLTVSRDERGQVSQALAWADLTCMRLDGNKVI